MLDPYATHLPVLAAAVASAGPGPVLELGAGAFSTPMLHAICAAMGRPLLTLDDNSEGVQRFTTYRSEQHRVEVATDWEAAIPEEMWAVVFVDHAPGERRVREIARLREACELMVVHDTEDSHYGYEPLFEKFTHRLDYKRLKPWTTLLSMTRPLAQFSHM